MYYIDKNNEWNNTETFHIHIDIRETKSKPKPIHKLANQRI